MNKNIAFYIILVVDALYLILAILGLCVHGVNDWSGFALTAALGLLGVMCGWVVGFLASPTSKDEETTLNKYAKTISVFISGYVASKAEPIITKLTSIEYLKKYLLFSPISSLRVIIFSYCFLSGTLLMYISRSYFNAQMALEKAAPKPVANPSPIAKLASKVFTKVKSFFGGPAETK